MKYANAFKSSLCTAALACLALVAASKPADASSTATTTFQVTATIQATCIVSATPMAFGTYTGALVNSTSTVTVTCTNTTPYNVGLDKGTNGGSVTTRQMKGTLGALLNYSLYYDSARTHNWGITIGTDTVAGTGNGAGQGITVYGQLPAGQYLAPDNYTDTITATVTY